MEFLLKSFLKGLLFVVPVTVTIFVVMWVFRTLDGILDGLLHAWLGRSIPGLGLLFWVSLTVLVGALASNIIFSKSFSWLERGLTRLPLVKLIYFSIKDLIGAFVGEKRRFSVPVLVHMWGDPAIKMVGFLTQEEVRLLDQPGDCAVYLPQAYNFSGVTVVVPRDRLKRLPESEAARYMAFIVSGGVSTGSSPGNP